MLKRFVPEDELHGNSNELKLTPCPFCKRIGTLIHHGWLYGYLDTDASQKTVRARRVFCNNRKTRNNGCGHTFTIWAAETLKRSCLKATGLWRFLKDVLELANKAAALRKLNLASSSAYLSFPALGSHFEPVLTELSIQEVETRYVGNLGMTLPARDPAVLLLEGPRAVYPAANALGIFPVGARPGWQVGGMENVGHRAQPLVGISTLEALNRPAECLAHPFNRAVFATRHASKPPSN